MSTQSAAPKCRHPELVSGSIAKLALPNRRQAQPHRQINPLRVFGIDEIDFPRPMPVFQLLLARNGRLHCAENFEMDQSVDCIFGSMPWHQTAAMLRKPFQKVRGDTDVERAVKLAGKYIYARLLFLSHWQSLAAKWTLKQVQGDGVGNG